MIIEIEEEIEIGELFFKLNITKEGEYEVPKTLEVDTYLGWKKVEGLKKTKLNPEWEIETENGIKTCFTDFHRVETKKGVIDNNLKWSFVEDLKKGDYINTKNGWDKITKCHFNGKYSNMYDLQVEDTRSFYTDKINSHNSMFMGNLALNAFYNGHKVLFYTFEMSYEKVIMRYYQNMANMAKSEALLKEEEFQTKLINLTDKIEGDLIVKEYNSNSADANDLMAHVHDLEMYKKWKPEIIFIDYILIMLSTEKGATSSNNSNLYYKRVSEDIRNIGKTLEIPIVSAIQINREGMSDKGGSKALVTAKDISASRGVYDTADYFGIISQTAKDRENNRFMLLTDKNREGDISQKLEFKTNYDLMRIEEGGIITK